MAINSNTSQFQLYVHECFIVIPKEPGRYHSFPTLIRDGKTLWMACRSAKVDQHQMHGFDGIVRLLCADVTEPACWQDRGVIFELGNDSSNEIDAILSCSLGKHIFLATRDYDRSRKSTPFFSRWNLNDFKKSYSEILPWRRKPLKELSDTEITCFGHIQETTTCQLLMPGYGLIVADEKPSPLLLASEDGGKSWTLRSVLARSDEEETLLTEFSLGNIEDRKWLALIRNETPPCNIMHTQSNDGCRTWSSISPTGLIGHAPMVLKTANGEFLVLYRDLSADRHGIGIGISTRGGTCWQKLGCLASYHGDIYDGGYGDLLAINESHFLAVYYLCDEDASPWIEGAIFSVAAGNS
jgi:hypothetical protein